MMGLDYQQDSSDLVINDPNVRVEAVKSGQGVALYDELVSEELEREDLFVLSNTILPSYAYFLCQKKGAEHNPAVNMFREWLLTQTLNASSLVEKSRAN